MTKWRFQPVYIEEGDAKVYSLCEVHFDASDKLEAWTAECFMHPQGDDMGDLQRELTHMLSDAYKWMPVRFSDLKVGMVFQRAVSQEDAEKIAALIEAQGELCRGNTRQLQ